MDDTIGSLLGRLSRMIVRTSSPNVRYETAPTEINNVVMTINARLSTPGNFLGSFMDSVIGITFACKSLVLENG